MSKWLTLALASVEAAHPEPDSLRTVPIVSLVPEGPSIGAIDPIGTVGGPNLEPRISPNGNSAPCANSAVSANSERTPIIAPSGHPAFVSAFQDVASRGPFQDMPFHRWRAFLRDGPLLCSEWSDVAASLGWSPDDFFGFDPCQPWSRIDRLGLAFLIDGQHIFAMDATQARLGNGSMSFYRPLRDRQ